MIHGVVIGETDDVNPSSDDSLEARLIGLQHGPAFSHGGGKAHERALEVDHAEVSALKEGEKIAE